MSLELMLFETHSKFEQLNQVLRKQEKLHNSQNVNIGVVANLFAYEYNMGRRFRRSRVPIIFQIKALSQLRESAFFVEWLTFG